VTSTLQVDTSRFGYLEVDHDKVVYFDDGLLGFPDVHKFAVIEVDDNPDFFWLQCLDNGDLAFLAVAPWPYFPDYEVNVNEGDLADLGLEEVLDVSVLCLLTVDRECAAVSANLLGPVVINTAVGRAKQVVLGDSRYPLRAPLGGVPC
jgi:flagellar assembly factor FliW